MSKLFFDHLLELEDLDKQIKRVVKTKEEREEIWMLVDEIIHHKAMGCILDKLPRDSHEEFLELFHTSPHDNELIFSFLRKKIGQNIEEVLKLELGGVAFDLLNEISPRKTKTPRKR